ncbi:ribokinase [Salipiger pallidus]|uniref:Ribokinase n=1 Tax=Salipiger pallidus TaxID=1775170 RepID=A0A8J2ZMG7_9RHOB|nr:PfkB family carbohydrate kinase [Salipiger pallidus]GGG83631.1 ribokinase [Salipiger pallidus]
MLNVFGSINLDIICDTQRVPGPGETLAARSMRRMAGGKGANQAVAAARAGAGLRMFGMVGHDDGASLALANLRAAGADVSGVGTADSVPTGTAIVMVEDSGENRILIDEGANGCLTADMLTGLGARDWLVLQLEVPADVTRGVVARAAAAGAHVLLNLAPAASVDRATLEQVRLLVVNETEAQFLASSLGCAPDARALSGALGNTVLRTLGAEGAEAFGPMTAGQTVSVPSPRIRPRDTTAAGDTFIGYLAAALEGGVSLPDAMARAARAAALTCLSAGSQDSIPDAHAVDAADFELNA